MSSGEEAFVRQGNAPALLDAGSELRWCSCRLHDAQVAHVQALSNLRPAVVLQMS